MASKTIPRRFQRVNVIDGSKEKIERSAFSVGGYRHNLNTLDALNEFRGD